MTLLDRTLAVAATNSGASTDRGVLHQTLTALGVSTGTAHDVQVVADGPIKVLIVLVVAFVLTRLVGRVSTRLVRSFRLVSPLVGATQRGTDRARTLAGVFTSVFRAIIWVIAVLTILGELGIELGPFVATATVIGAAVGFGAQTLVKDFLSGVLILAEDQYGVGDSVTIASSKTSGVVESVSLRTTRVRGIDGVVWYVPNGDIRAVGNGSETDSKALVDLVVPHGADLVRAGEVACGAAARLADDDRFRPQLAGPPTFLGIQDEDSLGVTLRIAILTKPGQDAPVARQARLLILEAWRLAGLDFQAADFQASRFEASNNAALPASPVAGGTPDLVAAGVPPMAAADPGPAISGGVGLTGGSSLSGGTEAASSPPTPRSGQQRPRVFRPRHRDT